MKINSKRCVATLMVVFSTYVSAEFATQSSAKATANSVNNNVKVLEADKLQINDKSYFAMPGLNVTVFSDIYPDGHQTGVTIIQHGNRVAANGDVRLEISPGQWSPVPAGGAQQVDKVNQKITQYLSYPDSTKDRKGFNPIIYPDLKLTYSVTVTAVQENKFKISVDFDKPIPDEWVGKIGFNFELFPGNLFGKSYLLDQQGGIFPEQANGPIEKIGDEFLSLPLAIGKKLVVAPEYAAQRLSIESLSGNLELWDGRTNHNNGWFIVRSKVPANATKNAIEWIVEPNVIKGWKYSPVIQVSQLGYALNQLKKVVIEQDATDVQADEVSLYQVTSTGNQLVRKIATKPWGNFLRFHYVTADFSDVKTPGMYLIGYRNQLSHAFKISDDVLDRHAWQPTLEYFLPVQMCHIRVNEKYRVWHGLSYNDDALMAPVNLNHFDGYLQGPSTLTKYKPGEHVPGLNAGGWHDAGDFDLRVESQMGTVYLLAEMVEEFDLNYDATSIDQKNKVVEIHQPDGKNDALQQIEHGLLSVLGGYRSMGRVYRGIIESNLRQYVLLGDAAVQTDGLVYDKNVPVGQIKNNKTSVFDDRWVFTEDNPDRELEVAGGLAAASRVLKNYDAKLAQESLTVAEALFQKAHTRAKRVNNRVFALAELYLANPKQAYLDEIISLKGDIIKNVDKAAWPIGRLLSKISDQNFVNEINEAVKNYQLKVRERAASESPYGVPYKPYIWGAGWGIQEFGVEQYFFHKSWPQFTSTESYENALNFVLGVHPGENTQSFASGVGAHSATVAYGANRADWSYIPGGVVSGTALIRPDLPEFKIWPYFWQQTEYVMGGGETNYMFLVLAVQQATRK